MKEVLSVSDRVFYILLLFFVELGCQRLIDVSWVVGRLLAQEEGRVVGCLALGDEARPPQVAEADPAELALVIGRRARAAHFPFARPWGAHREALS